MYDKCIQKRTFEDSFSIKETPLDYKTGGKHGNLRYGFENIH